jgi:hypothetical protein
MIGFAEYPAAPEWPLQFDGPADVIFGISKGPPAGIRPPKTFVACTSALRETCVCGGIAANDRTGGRG